MHKAESILIELENTNLKDRQQLLNFKEIFIEELYEIKGDNVVDFTKIWEWFKPNKEWENIIGLSGKELGTMIFFRVEKWKRNHDFIPGSKVSLNNEFGVVINNSHNDELYGLICWDTKKESDTEDWRGLFDSFLQAGGKVIKQDYEFKFINSDGSRKKSNS